MIYAILLFSAGMIVFFGRIHASEGRALRRLQAEIDENLRLKGLK